jgi:hypothetical protein
LIFRKSNFVAEIQPFCSDESDFDDRRMLCSMHATGNNIGLSPYQFSLGPQHELLMLDLAVGYVAQAQRLSRRDEHDGQAGHTAAG